MGLAFFVLSALVAIGLFFRKLRKRDAGWVPVIASFVAVANFYLLWQSDAPSSNGDDCYVDWDGRSNATICE